MNESPTVWMAVITLVSLFFQKTVAPMVDKLVGAKVNEMESRRLMIEEATHSVSKNSNELHEMREAVESLKDSSGKILAILEKEE